MKRIATVALSLLVLGAMASPVMAQSDVAEPLGSLYLSPINDQYQSTMQLVPLFAAQTMYLVADVDFGDIGAAEQNASNGIRAWEGSITVPASMIITNRTYTPTTALNFGLVPNDYIVGTGVLLAASSMPRPLLTIDFILSAAIPAPGFEMVLGPPLSSPQTVPGQAVWQEALTLNGCTNRVTNAPEKCFFPFAFLGSLTISTGVSNHESTWGGLKQVY